LQQVPSCHPAFPQRIRERAQHADRSTNAERQTDRARWPEQAVGREITARRERRTVIVPSLETPQHNRDNEQRRERREDEHVREYGYGLPRVRALHRPQRRSRYRKWVPDWVQTPPPSGDGDGNRTRALPPIAWFMQGDSCGSITLPRPARRRPSKGVPLQSRHRKRSRSSGAISPSHVRNSRHFESRKSQSSPPKSLTPRCAQHVERIISGSLHCDEPRPVQNSIPLRRPSAFLDDRRSGEPDEYPIAAVQNYQQ
jgi:hypothetical protein